MTDRHEAVDWSGVLSDLLANEDLTEDRATRVMAAVMRGEAEPAQLAALLLALRAKGEAPSEMAGFVRAMTAEALPIDLPEELAGNVVDVVGTGGDRANTGNISTLASVVVAAAGQPVAKHGNRAASSACGSADLLEAWGIELSLAPADVAACIQRVGIGFLFARTFHPAMRHAAEVRAQLGIRTAFNVLGPLSNPAGAPRMAVGVPDRRLAGVMAEALARLGKRHVLVFRGSDGLDELTTTGVSEVWEVRDGEVTTWELDPADLGIARARPEQLRGGDLSRNLDIAESVLTNEAGPHRDIVLLNAAAGLYAADAVPSLEEGVACAAKVLESGEAQALRDRWVALVAELVAAHGD